MTDWNIQSRAHACEACGKGFADKEHYHTLLFDERAAFKRIDVCQECWTKQYEGARERKGFISHWVGMYEAPPPPTEVIQKENAEGLLRKIIELNDPKYVPAAYILAVMLERKRVLKVKEQLQREGQRVFIYEHGKSGDVFTIVDPNLQLNQLEAVQHDVAALMEHGLNPGGPAAEGTTPGSEPAPPTPAPTGEPAQTTEAAASSGEPASGSEKSEPEGAKPPQP